MILPLGKSRSKLKVVKLAKLELLKNLADACKRLNNSLRSNAFISARQLT